MMHAHTRTREDVERLESEMLDQARQLLQGMKNVPAAAKYGLRQKIRRVMDELERADTARAASARHRLSGIYPGEVY